MHYKKINHGTLVVSPCQTHRLQIDLLSQAQNLMALWTDKACLVALGNEQEYQTDYNETFTLIAKMTTVHTILALAASQSWLLFH